MALRTVGYPSRRAASTSRRNPAICRSTEISRGRHIRSMVSSFNWPLSSGCPTGGPYASKCSSTVVSGTAGSAKSSTRSPRVMPVCANEPIVDQRDASSA